VATKPAILSSLLSGIGLVAFSCTPLLAQQHYPVRPLRLVVPSSPGGGADIVGRILAPRLADVLGQQVVVENRPGAGTMIGGEVVAKSPPDGYTLLMAVSTISSNPVLYKKMPYDAIKDFAPITQAAVLTDILAVHPSLPAKSVKDLIVLARLRPGQLVYSSAGTGTPTHLAGELFDVTTKVKMTHVPYKGGAPAVIALLIGEVSLSFATMPSVIAHVRSGRLRALAVTSAQRWSSTPELPTVAESGVPGFEVNSWYGLLVPVGTPKEIIARLNSELVRILHTPEVKQRISSGGAETVGNAPGQFGVLIKSETEKWARVVKDAGVKPE
jgi:tripartite-type tricarboxylate transporter receptor subunit TctC